MYEREHQVNLSLKSSKFEFIREIAQKNQCSVATVISRLVSIMLRRSLGDLNSTQFSQELDKLIEGRK